MTHFASNRGRVHKPARSLARFISSGRRPRLPPPSPTASVPPSSLSPFAFAASLSAPPCPKASSLKTPNPSHATCPQMDGEPLCPASLSLPPILLSISSRSGDCGGGGLRWPRLAFPPPPLSAHWQTQAAAASDIAPGAAKVLLIASLSKVHRVKPWTMHAPKTAAEIPGKNAKSGDKAP